MGDENRAGSRLADRLGSLIDLAPVERAALESLEHRERAVKRGVVLLRERDVQSDLYVVRDGMMMSYVLLQDGSRQILRFLFPGDMISMSALVYRRATESVSALADSVVSPVERSAIAALLSDHPRLAGLLIASNKIERVALTDRLAALGRSSAKARIAGLLLELRNRVRETDKAIGATFRLGLTQEEIGDATGLTAVHVNRMMRQLVEDGLIGRGNGTVTLYDEELMARVANHIDRYQNIDLGWLPAPR